MMDKEDVARYMDLGSTILFFLTCLLGGGIPLVANLLDFNIGYMYYFCCSIPPAILALILLAISTFLKKK